MNLALNGYSIAYLTEYVGISRQSFYKRLKAKERNSVMVSDMEKLVKKERSIKSRAGLIAIFHRII